MKRPNQTSCCSYQFQVKDYDVIIISKILQENPPGGDLRTCWSTFKSSERFDTASHSAIWSGDWGPLRMWWWGEMGEGCLSQSMSSELLEQVMWGKYNDKMTRGQSESRLCNPGLIWQMHINIAFPPCLLNKDLFGKSSDKLSWKQPWEKVLLFTCSHFLSNYFQLVNVLSTQW